MIESNLILEGVGMNLAYLGASTDDVTDKLIGLADFYIQENENLNKLNRRVTFIIAECFQNVVRHGISKNIKQEELVNNEDFFQIRVVHNEIRIYSKNVIPNNSVNQLDKQIEFINSMSKDQLKTMWREQMEVGDFSQKGGAGLGLIEISRKCGFPLEKKFIDNGNGTSDFYLGILMSKPSDSKIVKLEEFSVEKEYTRYLQNGIIIDYQGDFSTETSSFLIEMIHSNLVDVNSLDTNLVRLVSLAIEMIQNISKHGALKDGRKSGSFSIGEKNSKRTIKGTNYILKSNEKSLQEVLIKLKNSDLLELKKNRNKRIFEEEFGKDGNANLGLLEMALFSQKNFQFTFAPIDKLLSKFTLEVQIDYK